MKKWKQAILAALFCTCTTLTGLAADTAKAPAEAAVQIQATETGAEKTAEKASVPTDPLAGHTGKIIDKYYLTKGSTYKDVTTLLQTIDSQRTGLDATTRPYYFRVDKDLTDKYFRRVRAYDDKTTEQIGEYLTRVPSGVWIRPTKA